jgi:hypothetical protein
MAYQCNRCGFSLIRAFFGRKSAGGVGIEKPGGELARSLYMYGVVGRAACDLAVDY